MRSELRILFQRTLPGSDTRAIWAFGLFLAVQLADAAQTVHGISRFGPGIEDNPILSFYVVAFGAGTALAGAKTVAILGGAALHACSHYFILVALTVACVFGAIVPWALVLSS
jgi:hypothetical protein